MREFQMLFNILLQFTTGWILLHDLQTQRVQILRCIVPPLQQLAGNSKILVKEYFSLTIIKKNITYFFPFIWHERKSELTFPVKEKKKSFKKMEEKLLLTSFRDYPSLIFPVVSWSPSAIFPKVFLEK